VTIPSPRVRVPSSASGSRGRASTPMVRGLVACSRVLTTQGRVVELRENGPPSEVSQRRI
jgi:hypothetical protein